MPSPESVPGLYRLPPQAGLVLARFDGGRHPLLEELNVQLDASASLHGETGVPGTIYDQVCAGDPFYLSMDLIRYSRKLAAAGAEEVALEVLDQGTRWPETQIHGVHYEDLAARAGWRGKADFALAVTLDNDRIMAGNGPSHLSEVLRDEHRALRMAYFASFWLARTTRVYDAVKKGGTAASPEMEREFFSKVDMYSQMAAIQMGRMRSELPREGGQEADRTSIAVKLGVACTKLYQAGEAERASFLEVLDENITGHSQRYFLG